MFDSKLNLQGVAVKAGYMLADAVCFNLTWAYAWQIDDAVGTGGLGDITINPMDQYQIFQADLKLSFSTVRLNDSPPGEPPRRAHSLSGYRNQL